MTSSFRICDDPQANGLCVIGLGTDNLNEMVRLRLVYFYFCLYLNNNKHIYNNIHLILLDTFFSQ